MAKLNAQPFNYNHRPGPGRVNLLLSGFYKQRLVTNEQIVEALSALPSRHIEGLQVIKYDPEREIQRALATTKNVRIERHVMGAFYYASDLAGIVIYRFDNELDFYHMLYHELGHYVFLRILNQALRDEWIYRVRGSTSLFVSHYAATTAVEDFAECYAHFCVFPQVLAKIPAKMRFIAETVFYLKRGTYDFAPTDEQDNSGTKPAYPQLY